MDASAAEPAPSDSQEAFVGNPLALDADDGAEGLGDGESAEAADLPPASELLPKLHLALKMAGHGNWPRLAVPVLLLPIIGLWAASYYFLHVHQLNADFRDILAIYYVIDGPMITWSTFMLNQRIARADGKGALDVLEKLPISPEGAQDLKRAEFWAGNAPTSLIPLAAGISLMEWAGVTSGWDSEAIRYIVCGAIIIGAAFGGLAPLNASVGADLACCAIVRDQLRQTTRRLDKLVTSSIESQTDPAFDFRATMAEMHRLTQHAAQCERANGHILLIAGYIYAGAALLYIYGTATSDPGAVALSVFLLFFGSVHFAQAIDLLLGPLSLTAGAPPFALPHCLSVRRTDSQLTAFCAGSAELYAAANNLKFALPMDRQDEADKLLAVLKEQNAGQGPGYAMLGVVVRSSKIWTLAGGMLTLVASAGISVIQDAETDMAAAGSFGA